MISLVFDHLGIAVADLDKALESYREIFGYELLRGPYDDPIQQVRVCFIGLGGARRHPIPELALELVAPLGAQSPVKTILDKGGGAYHACYRVSDIEQALSDLRAKGCFIVSRPVPAVAFGGARIAWLYTPSRQLLELVEREF
ncbi:MAG: VOC family protein [Acidobacteria bacterium]|nr:VOC family protein [Acidobacteriota bacterium]